MNLRIAKAAPAVLMACVLTACSSDSGDGPSHTSESPSPNKVAGISVPTTYDNSQGWQERVTPGGLDGAVPLTTAPRNHLVTYLDSTGDGYVIKARDEKTGKLRWRSRPWTPPVPEESQTETGDAPPPHLAVVTSGDAEYVVAYAYGEKQADELSPAREVVEVVSYRADSSGQAVAPLKTTAVSVSGEPDRINADGSGVVIAEFDRVSTVDVATGRTREYESCDTCEKAGDAFAMVDKGLVVSSPASGYEVLGAWDGEDTVPDGYRDGYGNAIAVTEDYVIGTWDHLDVGHPARWVVHDARSGAVVADMPCSPPEGTGTANPTFYTPSVSANGRYLVVGTGAFDLKSKKGYCFEGTDERNPIELLTVDDNGVAYGVSVPTDDSEPRPQVQVPLKTAVPRLAPDGATMPAANSAEYGYFIAPTGSGKLALGLIAYPHR
ncbi:hypothetical protein FCH28_13590 [Streptomyces piniterrae]|uniref:PQQ-like beta-propeller repeat protein n=1 Tax=Streptomyces piniterrae TaxID=2571125 RepID=A0A4U0NJ49_9ACTN|nr:hypothetical protein [Streptomyces piniterrae]TJZ54210.1 hypothetical protein FCH28_13590 [Streptomyces piniterrae]